MKAHFTFGRLSVVAVALASCLLLGHCAWFSPPSAPSSGPSSGATQPQGRTITEGNLMTAADLPAPIGGGKVIETDHNARSLDQLSVCQRQPLETLGASAIRSRSFRARYPSGDHPFPPSPLDEEPDRYVVALQFADSSTAERAKWTYQSWVTDCRPNNIHAMRLSFNWSQVPVVDPAQAEVAEIAYSNDGSSDRCAYFESVGLTVLEDRMMITVHLFCTDESPYSVNIDDDEAGFAHPQLGLVEAAARRLSE